MFQGRAKIRLFVAEDLAANERIVLGREQAHYLGQVMRRSIGDRVALFNGRDGEWLTEIELIGRRDATLTCLEQSLPQSEPPDLWLCFAPIKKAHTDFIVAKACELGCRRIVPVFTRFTDTRRVNEGRFAAIVAEAAEQCRLVSVPEVAEPVTLSALLADWPDGRRMMYCDESGGGTPVRAALDAASPGPWAILTGPEGGFAPEEAAVLRAHAATVPVSLGPRIMRADTAAVAALAVWQAVLGDWR